MDTLLEYCQESGAVVEIIQQLLMIQDTKMEDLIDSPQKHDNGDTNI